MNKKILIVLANYYKNISDGLLKSALKNIPKSNHVKIIRVPGVFEIVTGISNTPGTDIILIIFVFGIKLSALFSNPFDISL